MEKKINQKGFSCFTQTRWLANSDFMFFKSILLPCREETLGVGVATVKFSPGYKKDMLRSSAFKLAQNLER